MITIRNLVCNRGGATVLKEVSLRIDDGEAVVIAGANGSGKTTLVRHFNGLIEPDSGTVSVDGASVSENRLAARTSIGMVFQNPRDCFVAATVGSDVAFGPENLGLSREEIDRRVESSLSAVDMTAHRNARIDRLSGGQQARVAIAGALAMEPDHLVLDEPFSGLDHPTKTSILRRLEALSERGTSLIVVTHDLRELDSIVDRLVVLSDGEIALETATTETEKLLEFGVQPC
jgi:biotin transport system ATP-binding protein